MFFFRDVVGHDALKENLIRTVQTGSMAHAQLFCGPEGVGKFAMAMAYARYIHCTDRGVDDACGKCASCMQYNALTHADLHFVFPIVRGKDKKKTLCDGYLPQWTHFIQENSYFSIDKWLKTINADNKQAAIYADESEAIWHKMMLKSLSSPYKIMIIWLPERMNAECANKLLKLLEEPAPQTYFFFVSNDPSKLLPTVLSRMRQIAMPVLSVDVIADALHRQYGVCGLATLSRSVKRMMPTSTYLCKLCGWPMPDVSKTSKSGAKRLPDSDANGCAISCRMPSV